MINFFNTAICAEIIALLVALSLLPAKPTSLWKLFSLFLLFTLLIESLGFYFKSKGNSEVIYNGFMPIQLSFYALLYFSFLKGTRFRFLVFVALSVFVLFFVIEAIRLEKDGNLFMSYQIQSRLLLSGIIVLLSCIFYYTLLRNDHILKPLQQPSFWIVSGLFFYYFGSIVIFAFRERVREIRLSGDHVLYELITGSLSVLLYGCWIIGFYMKRKQLQSYKA